MAIAKNKNQGAFFEKIFEHMAATQNVLPQKQHLAFRYLRGGKMLPIKTELDFSIVSKTGQVAYIDLKTFAGAHFTFSQLDTTQLKRAVRYNEWGVCSGFVVHFVGTNEVAYFAGQDIAAAGPRSRFMPGTGVALGTLLHFKVAPIFASLPKPTAWPRLHL